MRYRAEIDGLRSIAVVPVVLFHMGLGAFSGGFVGVDVFFIISGYLITTIIAADLEHGNFSIIKFYERRARRILPALMLTTALALPFAWCWLLPRDLDEFARSLVAVYLFCSNLFFWRSSNYFDSASDMKPLLHTWSLSVEEQYYVFFPLMLMVLWRLGRRRLTALLVLGALASLAAAQWAALAKPGAAFYLPLTRAWELLLGGLVAFHLARPDRWQPGRAIREAAAWIGLGLIAYAVITYDKMTPFPGVYALAPTVGACLIILYATSQTVAGRLLGSRIPVSIGLISYSLYLIHQPVFAFARHRIPEGPSMGLMLALAAACLPVAYGMWRFVEAPFRTPQPFSRRRIFQLSALGCGLFIAVGGMGVAGHGYPSRLPAAARIAGLEMPLISNGWCFYSVDSIPSLPLGEKGLTCTLGDKAAPTHALLFGDSFAGQYEPFWDRVGKEMGLSIDVVTTNWCQPSAGDSFIGPRDGRARAQCLFNRAHVRATMERYDVLILAGNWDVVLERGLMPDALRFIAQAGARMKRVVLMPTPAQFDSDVLAAYRKSLWFDRPFNIATFPARKDAAARKANAILEEEARDMGNALYIHREALFDSPGLPPNLTPDGVPFSFDGGHISVYGSQQAAQLFLASPDVTALRALLSRP